VNQITLEQLARAERSRRRRALMVGMALDAVRRMKRGTG
jgi:hypothetical protein